MAHARRLRSARRRNLFLALLSLGLLSFLLPRSWTDRLMNLTQVLVPFQHGATSTFDRFADAGTGAETSGEPCAEAEARGRALQHLAASLSLRVGELEQEVDLLTATRRRTIDGASLGVRGKLIPATIIGEDALSWRSSRLINAGSLQGVQGGAAVVSNRFTVGLGAEDGIGDGMAILYGEVLIGWIEKTATHSARVKLLTDPSVAIKVRVGRYDGERFAVLDDFFWLSGRGEGKLEIEDVDGRMVERGDIQVGDVVLSDPESVALPTGLTIGTIVKISPDRSQPLFRVLSVKSEADLSALRRVYVYDPTEEPMADARSGLP